MWLNLTEVPGTSTTVRLELSPYVYYSFRVLARNHVGFSLPSRSSRQYMTNPAGESSRVRFTCALGSPKILTGSWGHMLAPHGSLTA